MSEELTVLKERMDEISRQFAESQKEAATKLAEQLQLWRVTEKELTTRLDASQEKITKLHNIAWVCGVLFVIFGASGGWGWKTLTDSMTTIGDLQTKTQTLEEKIDDFDNEVAAGMKRIATQEETSLGEVTQKGNNLLASLNDTKKSLSQTMEEFRSQVSEYKRELQDQEISSLKVLTNEHKVYSSDLRNLSVQLTAEMAEARNSEEKAIVNEAAAQIKRLKSSGSELFASKGDVLALRTALTEGSMHLKCNKLSVVNATGEDRITLVVTPIDNGHFGLYNHDGTRTVAFSCDADRGDGQMSLHAADGQHSVSAGTLLDGRSYIDVWGFGDGVKLDDQGKEKIDTHLRRVSILTDGNGHGGKISVKNNKGAGVVDLEVDPNGFGIVNWTKNPR